MTENCLHKITCLEVCHNTKNSPRAVFCVSKPELVFIEVDPGLLNAAGAVGVGAEE